MIRSRILFGSTKANIGLLLTFTLIAFVQTFIACLFVRITCKSDPFDFVTAVKAKRSVASENPYFGRCKGKSRNQSIKVTRVTWSFSLDFPNSSNEITTKRIERGMTRSGKHVDACFLIFSFPFPPSNTFTENEDTFAIHCTVQLTLKMHTWLQIQLNLRQSLDRK